MHIIYETDNFFVEVPRKPHVTRKDGGHLVIHPLKNVEDRTCLSKELAIELMKLTCILGKAMKKALNTRGISLGRINYQDNGNWGVNKPEGPHLHIHLYGRARNATIQKYGHALHFPKPETGFYDQNKPLNEEDITEILLEIDRNL